jgi:LacI family transcriptional regulator
VLNKKPGIAPETRQAVLRAVEDLDYRLPERHPLRSATSRTLTILYHVKDEFCSEPYGIIPGFLRGARAFAREANVHLTIFAGYRTEDLEQIGAGSLDSEDSPPGGLILMGPGLCRDSESVVRALRRNIPAVVLCHSWPDVPISTVGHNHHEQARIALDHLVHLGYRMIALLAGETDEKYDRYQRRLECYRKTMADLDGRGDEELIILAKDGASAVKTLMARRPDVTAIFASHDAKAIQAMQGLLAMGLHVPDDVSVVGQDDARPAPEGLPGLTTVGFSNAEVGYMAAEPLLKQIENREIARANIWVLSHLVERESCCRARAV